MNDFLKAVHENQKKMIAEGLPVYDAEGKLVGRTGQDPAPEPAMTGEQRIIQGMRQKRIDAEQAIVPIVESMSAFALEARKIFERTSQWDFRKRLEAETKCRELYGKFEAKKKELKPIYLNAHGDHLEVTPYLKSVDFFVLNLERHFREVGAINSDLKSGLPAYNLEDPLPKI